MMDDGSAEEGRSTRNKKERLCCCVLREKISFDTRGEAPRTIRTFDIAYETKNAEFYKQDPRAGEMQMAGVSV